MKTHELAAALLICSLSMMGGCADVNYHYSQVVGTRYFRASLDTYGLSILRVDGDTNALHQALVEPGVREITVQGPPSPAASTGPVKTFALNVAPCTKYYLVGVKANRLDADYEPRVDFSEPVAGCTAARSSSQG